MMDAGEAAVAGGPPARGQPPLALCIVGLEATRGRHGAARLCGQAIGRALLVAASEAGARAQVCLDGVPSRLPTGTVILDAGAGDAAGQWAVHASPPGARLWRLETGCGRPLFGVAGILTLWQRPPYAATLRLVEMGAPDMPAAVLAQARIGTRIDAPGGRRALLDKAARVAAILVGQALRGVGGLVDPVDGDAICGHAGILADLHARARALAGQWRSRLHAEWWSIGVAHNPIGQIVTSGQLGPVRWMEPACGRTYLADPFARPGTTDVLCEAMPPGGPGRIMLLCADRTGQLQRGPDVLQTAGHLSYPCVFEDDGAVYVTPESVETDETCIWRLQADGSLLLTGVVATGDRLADPTLFRAGGRLWLAATNLSIGAHDNLCLFHADSVAGPWRAHRGNPVKIDVTSSRPAGAPFYSLGRLIRPAQDCAARYGAAVTLCEVLELSPERFRERIIRRIAPDPRDEFPHGLHTMSQYGPHTLIDGMRLVFSPGALLRKARRRAARAFSLSP